MSGAKLWVAIILVSTGCATTGVLQTPQPLGKGGTELAVEPGVWGAGAPWDGIIIPNLGLRAQFGVSDRVDVGGRLDGSGLTVLTRIGLTDPMVEGTALALAPSLGFGGFPDGGPYSSVLQVPLIIGVPIGGDHQFVFGPQFHVWAFDDCPGCWELNLSAGAQVGFAFSTGKGWTLLPEISSVYPFAGGLGGPNPSIGTATGALFQGALAVSVRL